LGLAGLALIALLATGASTSTRLNSPSEAESQARIEQAEQAAISPDPQETEPLTRKIGDGPSPNCEPMAVLTGYVALEGFSNQTYLSGKSLAIAQTSVRTNHSPKDRVVIGSISLVSSSLGRQFTLVGAKPSGTG